MITFTIHHTYIATRLKLLKDILDQFDEKSKDSSWIDGPTEQQKMAISMVDEMFRETSMFFPNQDLSGLGEIITKQRQFSALMQHWFEWKIACVNKALKSVTLKDIKG
jgi:hypothetical protein